MKKFLGILFLCLLWSNISIAAEREPGTDKKCFYQFEKAKVFEKKFLPKVNKDQGVFVTYVGCNKYYDDWSWDYSTHADIDVAHEKAYYGCKTTQIPKYNLTGCHLFSIDDVIVWGKDAAFVAKVEKEAKAKLTTKAVTGCIEGDCNNGQGTETFENGYKYVGEFKNGKRHGQGTSTWASGQKHVGEFKDGLPNGQGTQTFPNGYKYVGEFKDGLRHGQGTATWANGDKYVGEWKNDEPFKEVSTTKVAKKQTKPEDAKPLNKGCIKLGTKEFNEKNKKIAKSREAKKSAFVFYFGCENSNSFTWHWYINDDLDVAKEKAYKECLKSGLRYGVKNCHLFSIGDKIVYGDAALITKIEEKLRKKLAKRKVNYVQQYLFSGYEIFSKMNPTTFKKLTFNEEKDIGNITKRTVRNSDWSKRKTFRSFSFTAEFEDNYTAKIFVEYEKGNKNFDKAEKEALFFSRMFGQMPYFLREYNDKIYVHNDNSYDDGIGLWWAQEDKQEFHINVPRKGLKPSGRQRCREVKLYSYCAQVMVHELAHVIQDLTGIISPSKWSKARKSDEKKFVSEYAKTNSREDFAESLTAWVVVRYKSDKISESDLKKYNEYIPNRLKMFDEMNFNTHPISN